MSLQSTILATVLLPLLSSAIVGIANRSISRIVAHWIPIVAIATSFILSCVLFNVFVIKDTPALNFNLYHWVISGRFQFNIGFLIDRLSATLFMVVNLVSLLVHVYSIGYMRGDPGYRRFFSYMSLFTFAMLMLVSANNFLQLFFGWEGVGLVSYLLISFWFTKKTAIFGGFKAFIVNRIGDFAFILGTAAILTYFGSVDFSQVFALAPKIVADAVTISIFAHTSWPIITVICILLFVGAMGKSAQMPLHVWLPESMEGPTPISALIHAATMVTAGVYMLARLSPLYALSPSALTFVLVVGATTALFTGILGLVQTDIKRVIAYSTLSQLGYMVAAMGASAFAAGIFHLITHAAFKALLFLAAGSVIMAVHHDQDMRKMGGLRRYLPVTYITFFIGALALAAIPPFSGFYSKDAIIDAVRHAGVFGAHYAYVALILSVFITALYIFRALFMIFHGKPRMSAEVKSQLKENSLVVLVPLILLAIPAIVLGMLWVKPMLYQGQGMLGKAVYVAVQNDVLTHVAVGYHGAWYMAVHAFVTLPFYLAMAGILVAWFCYRLMPQLPEKIVLHSRWLYNVLLAKYGFDDFNQRVLVRGIRAIASVFYHIGDVRIIDDGIVNGVARMIRWSSIRLRQLQSGYLYHYALAMITGLVVFGIWQVLTG